MPSLTLMYSWPSSLKILIILMAVRPAPHWLIPTSWDYELRREVQRQVSCHRSSSDTSMIYPRLSQPCMKCRVKCIVYPGLELNRINRTSKISIGQSNTGTPNQSHQPTDGGPQMGRHPASPKVVCWRCEGHGPLNNSAPPANQAMLVPPGNGQGSR